MTVRKQDRAVLFLYWLGYPSIRNFLFRIRRTPLTRIVTFHDIPNTSEENFRDKLRCLKQYTNVISLEDYFIGRLSCEKVNVAVTFDDGYRSWIVKAAPALRELEIPATFFISSGIIDLSKAEAEDFARSRLKTDAETTGTLRQEDVRQLSDDGFTIGGHTYTHVNLEEMSSRSDILQEIITDKSHLESIIGRNVDYFAYPFGAWNNRSTNLAALLKQAGYKGAVTTVAGFNTVETNSYLLHRDLTGTPMPMSVFKARALGTYDAVSFLKRKTQGLRSR